MTLEPAVVIVGADGSLDAEAALHWAANYVEAADGRMLVVTAWTWPTFQDVPIQVGRFDPRKGALDLVEHAAAASGLTADRVQTRVVHGDPRKVLVEMSADADLLVLGAGGVRSIGGRMMGSVANYCVRHVSCPVLVVRAGDEHQAASDDALSRVTTT
jgi:nucleotide-binding universal stress UspA family protein